MKRQNYVFTIGFDGDKAIVDRKSRARYAKLNTRELADKELFCAAYRSAVFDSNKDDAAYVLEKLNASSSLKYSRTEQLSMVFGVQEHSDEIIGIRVI